MKMYFDFSQKNWQNIEIKKFLKVNNFGGKKCNGR
jgi:hypothetical protein